MLLGVGLDLGTAKSLKPTPPMNLLHFELNSTRFVIRVCILCQSVRYRYKSVSQYGKQVLVKSNDDEGGKVAKNDNSIANKNDPEEKAKFLQQQLVDQHHE